MCYAFGQGLSLSGGSTLKSILQELNNPHPGVGAEVELRIFRILTLITALLSFCIVIPFNLFQHLPVEVSAATALFGTVAAACYGFSRKERMYPMFFFFALLALLTYCWGPNAGSSGSVPYYFFAGIIYLVFFFRGWKRLFFMGILLADVLTLLALELNGLLTLVPFHSPGDRSIDLMVGFLTSGLACCIVLWVLVSTYDGEHERSRQLNRDLAESLEVNLEKTAELEGSIAEIRTLRGLLPICACCKKVRDDQGLWTRVEEYISNHTDVEFSHGLCPDCLAIELEQLNALEKKEGEYR